MTLFAAVVVAALTAALSTASATSPSLAQPTSAVKSPAPQVLGISRKNAAGTLAWFDPLTLRMLPGRKVPLAYHNGSWAFSHNRAVLAVGDCDGGLVTGIRFVNARAMRVLGDVRLPDAYDCATSLAWLRPDRLLAVLSNSSSPDAVVAVIDPRQRKLVRTSRLLTGRWIWGSARATDELVLYAGSSGSFAPATVVAVDAEGAVRSVTVERVFAGTVWDDQSDHPHGRTVTPGFAVDPEGRRAFLVPASGPVGEVDLRTLDVSYHDLDRPSLLDRFFRWLTPAAEAKAMEGPVREARWIGDGVLAVSGVDYSLERDATGDEVEIGRPVGVSLVDTASWRERMLSPESSGFSITPELVIAQGGRWDPETQRTIGPGIRAFGLDGKERWRLEQPSGGWLDAHGAFGYGYEWVAEGRMRIVDLATGAPLRMLKRNEQLNPWPQLLDAQASGW